MGILRSSPETSIVSSLKDFSDFYCVKSSVCGWQLFMSNFDFSFSYGENVLVIGMLEGHSGPQIAQFCEKELQKVIRECELMKLQQYQAAIQNLCVTLDSLIKENPEKINQIRVSHGLPQLPYCQESPASTSLIICVIDKQLITIGNLGQSKAYVSYKNSPQTCVLISGNHIIENDQDKQSIKKKGGFIADGLANGKFLHIKQIGNLKYKDLNDQSNSIIGCEPSVYTLRLEDLNAIVMGSSGLWERSQVVLRKVFEEKLNPLLQKEKIRKIIEELVAENCQDEFGKQNMTIQGIFFNY